jgi:gamma-glutamylcyclotransferase (GGCT)/AIG2-like uncharacterized protein YtfP
VAEVRKRKTGVCDVVDRLFVYGTLRTGQTARSLIAPHVVRFEPARIRGKIYAFPMGYPGLVDGDGHVRGELMWLSDLAAALALLDAYEGTDFVRMLRPVIRSASGIEEPAWVYALADPAAVHLAEPIPDGDWVRYWEETLA